MANGRNDRKRLKNMGLTDLKKELKKLDKDKLIDLVADLYKKNKSVKEFFDFYVNPDEKELFNKYRDKVFEAFYPRRGYNYKLKDGKQAISDFKKLGSSSDLLADLMLFYVETGVNFTNDFGDINEAFYSSMETTYVAALTLMRKENLLDKFADRASKVVSETNGIGWGFHDYLCEVHSDFYADYSDDIKETNM
ncbi:DUF6155 family protein [Algoriphagus aquimarinus]|uniref:DUF6155 family protein n=1 Tax=Algoriphagus aquimarinus TaxID=237018 RepID=UPI0030D88808|tara:strand:+ start:956 stop:1537 length:582 start_codon:yes stop_codon:yes gene_type:complete